MKTNTKKLRWSWIILFPILLRILMIALTFPYMFIYSALIETGQSPSYYEQYVFENRAWISTILGLPVFYYACYFMGKRIQQDIVRNCLFVVGAYIITDIPIEWAVGDISDWRLIVAHASKLVIGYMGGLLAVRKIERTN